MSFTEHVIGRTKHIESLLVGLGATGKGLHERASSIESLLNYQLLQRLRFIASVRNKLLHEHNYNFDGDEQQFLSTCDAAIFQLSGLVSARQSPPVYTPEAEPQTAIQQIPIAIEPPPASSTPSNGCLPAIVCAIVSCLVLPFSCTRTVTHGWWPFDSTEQIADWEQVIVWTLIWTTTTFFISRSATKPSS